MRTLLAAFLVTIAASLEAASASEPTDAEILATIQALGCRINYTELSAALPEASVDRLLDFQENAVLTGVGFDGPDYRFVLTEAHCPDGYAGPTPEPNDDVRSVVLSILRENDCQMGGAQLDAELLQRGIMWGPVQQQFYIVAQFQEAKWDQEANAYVLLAEDCN